MKKIIFNRIKRPLCAALIALLAACASGPKGPPEDIVRNRAEDRWLALQFGKFDMAYELTAPSYRAKADFAEYRKKFGPGMQWTGAEVVSVKCTEAKCNVRLRVDTKSPVPHMYDGIISTGIDEVWVLEDDKWWISVNP